eukprot:3650021-Rhodomonas_salina.2
MRLSDRHPTNRPGNSLITLVFDADQSVAAHNNSVAVTLTLTVTVPGYRGTDTQVDIDPGTREVLSDIGIPSVQAQLALAKYPGTRVPGVARNSQY